MKKMNNREAGLDAVIVGSGPNGLAAAITLAQAGRKVRVIEGRDTIGGGMRTAELTLPGFHHDICSAIQPMALASPFFRKLPLDQYGLSWIQPGAPLAHPLDDGTAVMMERSVSATAENLSPDGRSYRRLMDPFVKHWEDLLDDFLGPLPLPPKHPLLAARFGMLALLPATTLAHRFFKGERARALFAGLAAHSIQPLENPVTAGFGMMMGILAHAVGWPIPRGGSQKIADALGSFLVSLGGEIVTGEWVKSLEGLPPARVELLDVTPRQLLEIAGERLPEGYRDRLGKYRYGPGVFKIDWALSGPIPWKADGPNRAGTVHLGGTMEEIVDSEATIGRGGIPEKPFVLLAQSSLFDPSRAPAGKQTAWGYCHVPNGSTIDMTDRIEAQIERFAPGFKDCILARSVKYPAGLQEYDPNYVGGDINGGIQDLAQFFTRPVARWVPYSTPVQGLYICSSSTPPGGGVHGMCGYHAALAAIMDT